MLNVKSVEDMLEMRALMWEYLYALSVFPSTNV